ncbi:hypothetical protein [Streptomyces sp. NPDC006335]|uniref:hypothetical protein n=1 Tax=Streptomyces sp. NPDC006335 TaxID=3156895 RepID=UPI0033AF743D
MTQRHPLVPLAIATRELGHEALPLDQAHDIASEQFALAFGSLLPRRISADLKPIIADRKPDLIVQEVGNPAQDWPRTSAPTRPNRILGHPYLDICPPSVRDPEFMAGPVRRIELRPVPFSEPGVLPSWVTEHHEPLVYLTLGTATAEAGVLRAAIEGPATLNAWVVVAAGPMVRWTRSARCPTTSWRPWVSQAHASSGSSCS